MHYHANLLRVAGDGIVSNITQVQDVACQLSNSTESRGSFPQDLDVRHALPVSAPEQSIKKTGIVLTMVIIRADILPLRCFCRGYYGIALFCTKG